MKQPVVLLGGFALAVAAGVAMSLSISVLFYGSGYFSGAARCDAAALSK